MVENIKIELEKNGDEIIICVDDEKLEYNKKN